MGKELLLGQHLLLQLSECELSILEDKSKIRQALVSCAQITNSHVVAETFHNYNPHGITGVVVIQESHISIHTWPEHHAAVIDFFSCNLKADFAEVTKYLKGFFQAKTATSEIVERSISLTKNNLKVRSS